MEGDKQIFISASEMGDFIYCKRGWWLRFNEKVEPTEEMAEGAAKHDALSNQLQTNKRKKSMAIVMIIFALLCLIGLVIFTLLVT